MGVKAELGLPGRLELQRLRALYQLLEELSRTQTLAQVYEAALKSLLAATTCDRAAVSLFDDDNVIRFKAWRNLSPEYRDAVTGHTPWARGTLNPKPVVVPEVALDEKWSAYREIFTREGIQGLVFVPLELSAGVFGKLMLYYSEPHECTPDELDVAQAIATHIALFAERKQLQDVSLHLAAIVEGSDDAIVGKDLNGVITSWNAGAERVFGYTAQEAVGKPISMLAAPDVLNEMPDILSRIRRGGRVEHYHTRRRRKDGRIVDVSLTVSPVRASSGEIVGASKIARDVSDQKRAEQLRDLLMSREQEARHTAELLNRVGPRLAAQLDLEKLVQVVTEIATTLVGAETGVFFHNAVNEKGESVMLFSLAGVPREAFDGSPTPRNTAIFGPTFRGEGIVRYDDVTRDSKYGNIAAHFGMPAGHLPVRSYLAAPVVSRSKEVLGGLFFGHSEPGKFTENHEVMVAGIASQAAIAMDNARLFEQAEWAQTELKRSNQELRRANEDLETFAYSASHDLQEPLRTIAISAQLLERKWVKQLQRDDAGFLANILAAANRMTTLTQDLLEYMKVTKSAEGAPPDVDSANALAIALNSLKGQIAEAGCVVKADPLPVVSLHESRLAQVFQNLISNAIKYRRDEPPRVHISAGRQEGWWVFSIVDNGIGIELEYADQIFGLFKRLHGRDRFPGSGIGLAICQRIVEHYGGRIWLEKSVPGGGSTFCFSVPSCAS